MKRLLLVLLCFGTMPVQAASVREKVYAHTDREDTHGVIAPWHAGQNGPLDERLRIAV